MFRFASTTIVIAGAVAITQPAAAQLLQHKDISAEMAVTIATTAIATCKANGYAVSSTVVGRNGEIMCRFAAITPAPILPKTVSAKPIPRAPSAFRRANSSPG